MDWQEDILKGIVLIKKGCKSPVAQCWCCPFTFVCDILQDSQDRNIPLPDEWMENEEER